MAQNRVPIQLIQVGHRFCPQGIQVNAATRFQEAAVFPAQNRFVVLVEKVTLSQMTQVIWDGVARRQPAYHHGKGNCAGSQLKMKMAGHRGPGKTLRFRLLQERTRMVQETMAFLVILENLTQLNASFNEEVQRSRHVYA